jgi:hypothetical protein
MLLKLCVDRIDNNLRVWLTMTLLCVLMLLWLVLESYDLLFAALLFNSTFNRGTFNKWRSDNGLFAAYQNNLVKNNFFAGFFST